MEKKKGLKLNLNRTILLGLAFMSISGFWQLYDFIIPLILRKEFSISDTFSGFVMSLDNILALFLLPYFGALSDKFNSPLGKRMPFILVGTLLSMALMLVLPYAVSVNNFNLFVIALGFLLLAMGSYRSPAVALMPDLTQKPLRSEANALINLMGALGSVFVLAMIALLSPERQSSYYPVFIVTVLLMGVSLILMLVFVKENKWRKELKEDEVKFSSEESVEIVQEKSKEEKKSMYFILFSIAFWFMGYNAVISAFSRYATLYLDFSASQASLVLLVANFAAILAFVPIGKLSVNWGRKRMVLSGVLVLMIAFFTASFYQSYSPWMFINFILAGLGWAAINVNSLPMLLEMAPSEELGRFTGLYYTFSMAAQIVTPILSGLLFDFWGYRVLFPYASFFLFLALLTMNQVRHGDVILDEYP